MSYVTRPIAHQLCYRVYCARNDDKCPTRGGWSGTFYFDQQLPQICPGCHGPVRTEYLMVNKRKAEQSKLEQERKIKHDAEMAEYQRQHQEAAKAVAKRQEQEAIAAADGVQEAA